VPPLWLLGKRLGTLLRICEKRAENALNLRRLLDLR
jgi:hypothetical protein